LNVTDEDSTFLVDVMTSVVSVDVSEVVVSCDTVYESSQSSLVLIEDVGVWLKIGVVLGHGTVVIIGVVLTSQSSQLELFVVVGTSVLLGVELVVVSMVFSPLVSTIISVVLAESVLVRFSDEIIAVVISETDVFEVVSVLTVLPADVALVSEDGLVVDSEIEGIAVEVKISAEVETIELVSKALSDIVGESVNVISGRLLLVSPLVPVDPDVDVSVVGTY